MAGTLRTGTTSTVTFSLSITGMVGSRRVAKADITRDLNGDTEPLQDSITHATAIGTDSGWVKAKPTTLPI